MGFNANEFLAGGVTLRGFVDGVMLGAGVKDAEDVPTGPLGGTFRCGVQRSFCAWSDDSTGGALFYYQSPPTGSLAATALQFRSDAEH
jgi:hypothetical protein